MTDSSSNSNKSIPRPKNIKSSQQQKIKKGGKLPWWVELLFVQVGLPETLLIQILNKKKNLSDHFSEQKKSYAILSLILIIGWFINPIIQQNRTTAKCNNRVVERLSKIEEYKKYDNEILSAMSINYCNGGNNLKL